MRATEGAGLRFLREMPLSNDECIEYPFGRFTTGYGHVRMGGKGRTAHSVSFEMHVGPIPPGAEVCHECTNRACVNPRHLRADSHRGNMADKVRHGTHHRGSRTGRARLCEADVRSSRAAVASGVSQVALARRFGVSPQTVNDIVASRKWKHVA